MLGRVLGLCFRIALWLFLALAATILLYRFVPVPSTLMLGRSAGDAISRPVGGRDPRASAEGAVPRGYGALAHFPAPAAAR